MARLDSLSDETDRSLRLAGWALCWAVCALASGMALAGLVYAEILRPDIQLFAGGERWAGAAFVAVIVLHGWLMSIVPVIALLAAALLIGLGETRLAVLARQTGIAILAIALPFSLAAGLVIAWSEPRGDGPSSLIDPWDPILDLCAFLLLIAIMALLPIRHRVARWCRTGALVLTCAVIVWLFLSGAFHPERADVTPVDQAFPSEANADRDFDLDFDRRESLATAHHLFATIALATALLHACAMRRMSDPAWIYGMVGSALLLLHWYTTHPAYLTDFSIWGPSAESQLALLRPHAMAGVAIVFASYVLTFRWIDATGAAVRSGWWRLHAALLALAQFAHVAPFALLGAFGYPRRVPDYPESETGWIVFGAAVAAIMIALHAIAIWHVRAIRRSGNALHAHGQSGARGRNDP